MPVEVVGDFFSVEVVPTGLPGLDRALGGGIPIRSVIEVFGATGLGKTTLALFLAAVAGHSPIHYLDLEGVDPNYARECLEFAGFSGELRFIPLMDKHGDPLPAEDYLSLLLDEMAERGGSAIIDTVAAIMPSAEATERLDSGHVGLRARLLARFMRRAIALLRSRDCGIIAGVNHVHAVIGGHGVITPGGVSLQYYSAARIWVRKIEEHVEGVGSIVSARVEKRRFLAGVHAGVDPTFRYFVRYGRGVDAAASRVLFALDEGIAERGPGGVRAFGRSWGSLKSILSDAERLSEFDERLRKEATFVLNASKTNDG
jgi:RecA/RadA recombinase